MENDLKGNENYFELTGGSSYRGFELPGFECIPTKFGACTTHNLSWRGGGGEIVFYPKLFPDPY